MRPGDPTGTFCDCLLPDRRLEDGQLYCADCGRQIPEARDQLLVMVAHSVRQLDHRLDDLTKALARNVSTKPREERESRQRKGRRSRSPTNGAAAPAPTNHRIGAI